MDMNQIMKLFQNNSGMTLIEILIAVAIAAFGLLAYALLSGSIIEKNAESKKSTVAITLAQDKMEELKDLATRILLTDGDGLDSPVYDSSTNSWTPTTGGEIINAEGNTGGSSAFYTRTWTISIVGSATYFSDVAVTVTWDNGKESKSIESLINQ
jgi:prepilin-type N-terminal cleavage/methylation domain-containing protein